MFILRIISTNKVEENQTIGDHYELVTKKRSPERFEDIIKDVKGNTGNIYAFILGQKFQPLFKGLDYYIMTSEGKTFNYIYE